jgi:AraC family transcriptional regulator
MRVVNQQTTQTQPDVTTLRCQEFSEFVVEEKLYRENAKLPLHAHSQAICCIVLDGACMETYGRRIRHYRDFDSEFLPAHDEHTLLFQAAGTRCLSLQISESWLTKAKEYGFHLTQSVQSRSGVIMDLFMKIYLELQANDAASSFAIQGLTAEMLAHVMRQTTTGSTRRPAWLNQAKDLLHAQFAEQLKLCTVAEHLRVHPAHMAREFRKHFGKTMGQYVRELRIRQSMVELAQQQRTIAEIAVASGFADQSHFSRIFKEHTGRTPAEYRRSLQPRLKASAVA